MTSSAEREREEMDSRSASRRWKLYIDLTVPLKWLWKKLLEWNYEEEEKKRKLP